MTKIYMEVKNERKKLEMISNLFEGNIIRSVWDDREEDYYFSVIDVIGALTDNNHQKARNYWKWLKGKLNSEGSELVSNTNQLKLKSTDGKFYSIDVLDTKGILRLIESIPSIKAEPFKMWLAHLGKERIDEVFDPEIAINRAINYYREKGYPDEWIQVRLNNILNRKKLTDIWKEGGISKNYEYALLTNQIYKEWSGISASEYKKFKGIRKEFLRDNMTDIEIVLTDLGELTTRDIAKRENPQGLDENLCVAKRSGKASKIVRKYYEKETKKSGVSFENAIGRRYTDHRNNIKNDRV